MIGDFLLNPVFGLKTPFLHQLVQQLRMMNHLGFKPKFRILILQNIEGMRTSRHDSFHIVLLECLDVLRAQLLEQKFIAHPARRIARILLLVAENGEVDARFIHKPDKGLGDLAAPIVVRAHGADKEQHVEIRIFLHGWNFQIQSPFRINLLHPLAPVRATDSPWVALSLDVLHRPLAFLRNTALHQNEMTPEIHDFVDVLIRDRTLILAVAAGRACPNLFFRHDAADQLNVLRVDALNLMPGALLHLHRRANIGDSLALPADKGQIRCAHG